MVQLLTWFSEKKQQATHYLSNAYELSSNYASESFTSIKYIGHTIYQHKSFLSQFVDTTQIKAGAAALNPYFLYNKVYLCSPQSYDNLKQHIFENGKYLAYALSYECVIKPILRTIPIVNQTPLDYVFATAATGFLLRKKIRLMVDNVVRITAMTKSFTEENKKYTLRCEHPESSIEVKRAKIEAVIHASVQLACGQILAMAFPRVGILASSLAMGHSFLQYPLDKMCTEHQYDELARNNWYAFILGLEFFGLYYLSTMLLQEITQVNNLFIDDAIFNLLSMYFVMIALNVEKPYPGNKPGIDFFEDIRLAVNRRIAQAKQFIFPQLSKVDTKSEIFPILNAVNAAPLFNHLKMFILESDQLSLESYFKTPAIQLLLKEYGGDLIAFTQWLIDLRKIPLGQRVAPHLEYVPSFLMANEVKSIGKLVMDRRLEGVFEKVQDYLVRAMAGFPQEQIKVTNMQKENLTNLTIDDYNADIKQIKPSGLQNTSLITNALEDPLQTKSDSEPTPEPILLPSVKQLENGKTERKGTFNLTLKEEYIEPIVADSTINNRENRGLKKEFTLFNTKAIAEKTQSAIGSRFLSRSSKK